MSAQTIADINERFSAFGRPDLRLQDDATQAQIEQAQETLFRMELSRAVPRDGLPNQEERRARAAIEIVGSKKAPGFLHKLFKRAEGVRREAEDLQAKARSEELRVMQLQQQYDALKERLWNDEQSLDRARNLKESWESELAKIDSTESVIARFEAILSPGYPVRHKAEVVAADRHKLVAVIEYFPVIERVLLDRIAGLKSQIEEIEHEFL